MKKCYACKELLPVTEFYKDKSQSKGTGFLCKKCAKEYYAKNKEIISTKAEIYYDKNKDKILKRNKKWAANNREKFVRYTDKSKRKYPEKEKAHLKYRYALKKGTLVRGTYCTTCGGTGKRIEGHHPNYSKPLEVVWLCTPCHAKEHKHLREGELL